MKRTIQSVRSIRFCKFEKECNAIPYLLHDHIENLHATFKSSCLPSQVCILLLMELQIIWISIKSKRYSFRFALFSLNVNSIRMKRCWNVKKKWMDQPSRKMEKQNCTQIKKSDIFAIVWFYIYTKWLFSILLKNANSIPIPDPCVACRSKYFSWNFICCRMFYIFQQDYI